MTSRALPGGGFPTVFGRELVGELPAFVVGIGGGQAPDVAKFLTWTRRLPLFQVPTATPVNVLFGHGSRPRCPPDDHVGRLRELVEATFGAGRARIAAARSQAGGTG